MAQSRLLGIGLLWLVATPLHFVAATHARLALPASSSGFRPTGVAGLVQLEEKVKAVMATALPATVALRIAPGATQGSGVIVSEDGLVLTAGHVIGEEGRSCRITLADGRRVDGVTLGADLDADTGMIQILEPGPWPCVELAEAAPEAGDWCIALGHPGGYERDRPAVPRLGRILREHSRWGFLRSDCQIIRGDSGGPLFDLDGRLVGIHSRLEPRFTANYHVPMGAFEREWDTLLAARDEWVAAATGGIPWLGVTVGPGAPGCQVDAVTDGSPAAVAGIRAGDHLCAVNGQEVDGVPAFRTLVRAREPGDRLVIQVLRGDQTRDVRVRLGRRDQP